MAARLLLRPALAVKLTALAGVSGLALIPKSTVHAESPPPEVPETITSRKSIYDDASLPPPSSTPTSDPVPSSSTSPTPTDRLTGQVAKARIFMHKYAAATEDKTNELFTKSFDLEKSFTSTVASLAPPKESSENLMPGLIYVLVSAMGSSILVRNRNILLRASVPVAVGIGAGWYFIPITMRNVGDLVWKYEEKFPVVADTHVRVKERVTKFVETGIAHSKMGAGMLEDKVGEARDKVEDWVSKGK